MSGAVYAFSFLLTWERGNRGRGRERSEQCCKHQLNSHRYSLERCKPSGHSYWDNEHTSRHKKHNKHSTFAFFFEAPSSSLSSTCTNYRGVTAWLSKMNQFAWALKPLELYNLILLNDAIWDAQTSKTTLTMLVFRGHCRVYCFCGSQCVLKDSRS